MPSELPDGPSLMCHHLLQELFGTLVFRIGKKLFRRFIFQNLAFIDKNHTVGGSSNNITRGSIAKPRAIATRCC